MSLKSNQMARVATGLYAPISARVSFTAAPGISAEAVLRLSYNPLKYSISELLLRSENINAADLRTVCTSEAFAQVPGLLVEQATPCDDLVRAAHAYVKAQLAGGASAKAVADLLGVAIATAGRRIREAKDAGHIHETGEVVTS